MNKIFTLLILLLFLQSSNLWAQETPQRCAAQYDLVKKLEEQPSLQQRRQNMEKTIQRWVARAQQEGSVQAREVITIPVVVHIVWNKPEENISDEQIYSQIDVLNKDYRAQNVEFPNVPQEFKPFAADTELEFCLASVDPRGRSTTGIVRQQTNVDCIGDKTGLLKYDVQGGSDAWDSKHYLNIWVARKCDGFLGKGSFPGEDIPEEDGVVIDFEVFGTVGTAANSYPFEKGRTVTHEVGHYLNLLHLWGLWDANGRPNCNSSDEVADTPQQGVTYQNKCPTQAAFSCGSSDMYMNFMNWTNDACMSMFTQGQKLRMLATLYNLRPGLLDSPGCGTLNAIPNIVHEGGMEVFPNPANESVQIYINTPIPRTTKLSLLNSLGQVLLCMTVQSKFYHTIPVDKLPNGVYYIKSELENQFIVRKIIVAN